MLWNMECPVGLSQREICVQEIWRNLEGLPKNKELWSYVVKFDFSRPKGSSDIFSMKIFAYKLVEIHYAIDYTLQQITSDFICETKYCSMVFSSKNKFH